MNDILIKNMKMPKNCDECMFRHECEMSLRLSKRQFDCPFRQSWIDAKASTVIPESYIESIK